MRTCEGCQGFVPAQLSSCPNCDADAPRVDKTGRFVRFAVNGALSGAAAMTLMACYGAPGGFECDYPDVEPETLDSVGSLTASGDASMGSNIASSSCGSDGMETIYDWTPPEPGTYVIDVQADFDASVSVVPRDYGYCFYDSEIACNGDPETGPTTIELADTSPLFIIVDGGDPDAAGTFTISIEAQ